MLTIAEIIYYLLKSIGIWEAVLDAHKAKEKAQAIADSPTTKDELLNVLEQGKL